MSSSKLLLAHRQVFKQTLRIEIVIKSKKLPKSLKLVLVLSENEHKFRKAINKLRWLFLYSADHLTNYIYIIYNSVIGMLQYEHNDPSSTYKNNMDVLLY
jgi:hypothetical protein